MVGVTCSDGYKIDPNDATVCQQCSDGAATCGTLGAIKCQQGFLLAGWPINVCIADTTLTTNCGTGWFEDKSNADDLKCQRCSEMCNTCDSKLNCLTCKDGGDLQAFKFGNLDTQMVCFAPYGLSATISTDFKTLTVKMSTNMRIDWEKFFDNKDTYLGSTTFFSEDSMRSAIRAEFDTADLTFVEADLTSAFKTIFDEMHRTTSMDALFADNIYETTVRTAALTTQAAYVSTKVCYDFERGLGGAEASQDLPKVLFEY
jgi:hypothetical protein